MSNDFDRQSNDEVDDDAEDRDLGREPLLRGRREVPDWVWFVLALGLVEIFVPAISRWVFGITLAAVNVGVVLLLFGVPCWFAWKLCLQRPLRLRRLRRRRARRLRPDLYVR